MAAPFIDSTYLHAFLDVVLRKRDTAKIKKIFVREQCDKRGGEIIYFHKMFEKVLEGYDTGDQEILRKKVLSKVPTMRTKPDYFHAKFFACVDRETEEAAVLLMSANFTSQHFSEFSKGGQNFESIIYITMSMKDFKKNLIKPLTQIQKEKQHQ